MVRHWTRLPAHRDGPGRRARGCCARRVINADRPGDDRHRAGRRAGHQVPRTARGSRSLAMVVLFLLMMAHPPALRPRAATSWPSEDDATRPARCPSRVHAIVLVVQDPQADAAGARLRAGHRARRSSRRSRSTSTRTRPRRCRREWDAPRHPGAAARCSTRPYREITRPILDYVRVDPPRRARATSSSSTSPSTSSGTGGSSCCTTRARCGCKTRLLFTPGVMVASRARGSCASSEGDRRTRAGRAAAPAADAARGLPTTRRWTAPRPPVPTASRSAARSRSRSAPVAHGGHCVARHEGRVVFVRHALPGRAGAWPGVTEAGARPRFWRADAVEVLERVAGPGRRRRARAAGPGAVRRLRPRSTSSLPASGALEGRRRRRAAAPARPGSSGDVVVEAVPGATTTGWAGGPGSSSPSTPRAGPGCAAHRSHDVRRRSTRCRIAATGRSTAARRCSRRRVARAAPRLDGGRRRSAATVAARCSVDGAARARDRGADGRARRRAGRSASAPGPGRVLTEWRVAGDGLLAGAPGRRPTCWSTPSLDAAGDRRRGARSSTCTAGSGCSPAPLADAVGAARARSSPSRATPRAVDATPGATCTTCRRCGCAHGARRASRRRRGRDGAVLSGADVVVLDPPRAGAGRAVVRPIAAARPRARRLRRLRPGGAGPRHRRTSPSPATALDGLRAFDLFPMTHHVECVAALVRA